MPGTVARTTSPVTSTTRPASRRGAARSSPAKAPASPPPPCPFGPARGLRRAGGGRRERAPQGSELRLEARVDAPHRRVDDAPVASHALVGDPPGGPPA